MQLLSLWCHKIIIIIIIPLDFWGSIHKCKQLACQQLWLQKSKFSQGRKNPNQPTLIKKNP